jgi:calcineurin-like phosphoesterase family protein
MRSWRNSCHGSYHLHGHCHGTLPRFGKSLDVGCMNWNYKPLSLTRVLEELHDDNPHKLDEHDNGESWDSLR